MKSLYERIGGEAAVNLAVDKFYEKVISDRRISHFFEGLDMIAQARKQKAFLSMVFGGPNQYTGLDMRAGHAHLGLTDDHFNAVLDNLALTLKEIGVSDADIAEIALIALSVKDDVLNR